MSFKYHPDNRFVMVSDHPCYPSAEYFPTRGEAEKAADQERIDMEDANGDHDSVVFVAEILAVHQIKTAY